MVIMKFIHEIYTSRCSGHRHKLSQEMQMLTLILDFLGYAWYDDLFAALVILIIAYFDD